MFIYQKLRDLEKEVVELKKRIINLERDGRKVTFVYKSEPAIQEYSDLDGLDPLFEKAKEIVILYKKASSSVLMRNLGVGYARSAKIMDQLEDEEVVGPAEGAKPRKVLITKYEPKAEK